MNNYMIDIWLNEIDYKISDYKPYATAPVLQFHKFRRTTMDDTEKIFVGNIETLMLNSSLQTDGLGNKTAIRIQGKTSIGYCGTFWLCLYDGYYYLSLGATKLAG